MIYEFHGEWPRDNCDLRKKPRPRPIMVPLDTSLQPRPVPFNPYNSIPRKKMSAACKRKMRLYMRKSDLCTEIKTLLFLTCADIITHSALMTEKGRPSPEWQKMEQLGKLVFKKDSDAYRKLFAALGECNDRKAGRFLDKLKKMEKRLLEYERLTEGFSR